MNSVILLGKKIDSEALKINWKDEWTRCRTRTGPQYPKSEDLVIWMAWGWKSRPKHVATPHVIILSLNFNEVAAMLRYIYTHTLNVTFNVISLSLSQSFKWTINRRFTSKILHTFLPKHLSHIPSPLQSFCLERLHKLRWMTKYKAVGEAKVRDLIKVNLLTVTVMSQATRFVGLTCYGINWNIILTDISRD